MNRRPLGFNPDAGLETWWHEDGEGNWLIENVQNAAPILDLNKEAQNHCNPSNPAGDMRMVARIPLIVIQKWRNDFGIDYWNPDHQGAVDALLNSSDWKWLRTDTGQI